MVRALEEVLGKPINVSDEGHYMGALGAALFALERAQAGARGERGRDGRGEELAMLVAGIDIGSGTTKCVLVDEAGAVRGRGQTKTRADFEKVAREAVATALEAAGFHGDAIGYIATTGLGRYAVPFRDIQITDLTCGARGAATALSRRRASCWTSAPSARARSACATAARSRSST